MNTCDFCKKEYYTVKYASNKKYCSVLCCSRSQQAKHKKRVYTSRKIQYIKCKECGKSFPLPNKKLKPNRAYCSIQCRRNHGKRIMTLKHDALGLNSVGEKRYIPTVRLCLQCKNPFVDQKGCKKYCSETCRNNHKKTSKKNKIVLTEKTCIECNTIFLSSRSNAKFCKDACSRKAHKRKEVIRNRVKRSLKTRIIPVHPDLPGEIWKDVLGWEKYYQISNMGRIRQHINNSFFNGRTYPGHIIKQSMTGRGYLRITLTKKGYKKSIPAKIHRLVGFAFIPNPDNKPEINHKDTDKTNNRWDNLEWCTQKENQEHYDEFLRLHPVNSSVSKI